MPVPGAVLETKSRSAQRRAEADGVAQDPPQRRARPRSGRISVERHQHTQLPGCRRSRKAIPPPCQPACRASSPAFRTRGSGQDPIGDATAVASMSARSGCREMRPRPPSLRYSAWPGRCRRVGLALARRRQGKRRRVLETGARSLLVIFSERNAGIYLLPARLWHREMACA